MSFVSGPCFVIQHLVSFIKFCKFLAEEERVGCFTLKCLLVGMWLLVFCVSSSCSDSANPNSLAVGLTL